MAAQITAEFGITSWDEHSFDVHAGARKLARATVHRSYTGDITGGSVTEWLLAYAPDGTATFVGLERINGTVADRTGTLVLQHIGTYHDNAATADVMVLGGSCTGELADATGTGTFHADPSGIMRLELSVA